MAAVASLHDHRIARFEVRSAMRFARTKIQPPRLRREALVPRPGLQRQLAEALASRRLVLLSAAAGYGKTTALARQLEQLAPGTAFAWVSADEGDDPHRLLDGLLAALEPLDLPWRTAPEALLALAGDPRTRGRVVAELVNALEAAEAAHGVIVLDDLHRVDDGPFFELLDAVLERLGPRWTVALATRQDPPLALARLRGLGELAEFRQDALRFDTAEAAALAALAGVPAARADALAERTQGWPAGLRLALSRGAAPAPAAGEREMFDFLAAEVIGRLPPALRRFLLHSAVLPELTAARAAAVTGDAQSARHLREIERLGLFATALDAAVPTLKLHDLFRDALLQQLQHDEPEAWLQLWQRAAAGEADPARRVPMLLRAGDEDAAAEVLLRHAEELLAQGAQATVVHLVDQFPGEALAQRPALQLVLGLVAWARCDFAAMLAAMRRAEAGFDALGETERARAAIALQALAMNALGRGAEISERLGPLRREAVGTRTRVVVLQACLWHALDLGSAHRAAPLLHELMDRLERSSDATIWYPSYPTPELNAVPGTAPALRRYVDGALRLAGERPMPLRALAQVQRGWQLAWQAGDLDTAEEALAAAQDDARWLGDPSDLRGAATLLAAYLHTLRGNRARALAAAHALLDTRPATQGPAALWMQTLDAARIAALFGERERLAQLLAQLAQAASTPQQQRRLEPLRGHQAWLAGDAGAARRHWQAALADEAAIQRLGQAVELRLFLAVALLDADQGAQAGAVLQPVFQALADGVGRGAVLMARPAVQALAARDLRGVLDEAGCAALRGWLVGGDTPAVAPAEPLRAGGLSQREFEVLARIAAGDSNKLIARAFDLSPHTVKRHVANILDKLGLESRGQAAAWLRAQG